MTIVSPTIVRAPSSRDTLGHYFLDTYDRHPDRVLCAWGQGHLTYRDTMLRVAACVERFARMGLRRGHFVACYIEEQIPVLVFDLACALTGVIPVPLSPVFSADYFFKGIVTRMNAAAIMTTPTKIDVCQRTGCKPVVLRGEPGAAYGFLPEDEELDGLDELVEIIDVNPTVDEGRARELLERTSHGIDHNDLFMVQPTSGSTGLPKLVLRRHSAFTRYAEFVGRELPPLRDDEEHHRFLLVATLTHAFGLHMLTTALSMGASICVPREIDAAAKLEEVRDLDPTVLPLLPRIQRSFHRQWQDRDRPIFGPSARVVCSAGGPADADILDEFRRQDLDVIVFYGSTEASVVAVTPAGGWRPRHAGKVVDDTELLIARDGEVLVRSPGLTPGYFNDDGLTESVFTPDGFYKTGDLGEIKEGYLRIFGRKRDLFNTAEGSNIYPDRIELMIETQPWADQAILFGDGAPFLVAFIALADGAKYGLEPGARLPEGQARADYQFVGAQLARLNLGLEKIERIVRFLLFVPSLSPKCYKLVGPGKVSRDRKAANEVYGAQVAALYDEDSSTDRVTFVPGADRRLRPRATDVEAQALNTIRKLSETTRG